MARRRFFDYIDEYGQNCFQEWVGNQLPGLEAVMDARIQGLEVVDDLRRPGWDKLDSDCMGLYEIRVKYKGVHFRAICCFGPSRDDVTILGGATKLGRTFDPKNICKIALERRRHIQNRGRTSEHL